jgi:hypothetical protein
MPKNNRCQNCGTDLHGPYCSICGQHDIDYSQSFGIVFRDFLDSVFSFDAKVFRTISLLLTRPGDLTLRFLQGKRLPYLNPVRLYFSVSVLLFLTVRLLHFEQADTLEFDSRGNPPHPRLEPEIGQATLQTTPKFAANFGLDAHKNAWIKKRVLQRYGSEEAAARMIISDFWNSLPITLFLCVPGFALILKVLYRRNRKPYLAHLLFSFHLQTVVFLWAIVLLILRVPLHSWHPGLERWIGAILNLWLVAYLLLAQHRFYGDRWIKTGLKFVVLQTSYIALIIIATLLTVLAPLLMMVSG